MFLTMALLSAGLGVVGISGQNANIIASNSSTSILTYEVNNYNAVSLVFNFPDYYAPQGGEVNVKLTYQKNGRYITNDEFINLYFSYESSDQNCYLGLFTAGVQEDFNYMLGVKTYHGSTLMDYYSPSIFDGVNNIDLTDSPLTLGNVSSTNFKIVLDFFYVDEQYLITEYQADIDNAYNSGYSNGYNNGYSNGDSAGYIRGYDEAFGSITDLNSTAGMIVSGIINIGLLPVNIFLSILDFEVFGINVGALVGSLLTIACFLILWRIIKGTANSDSGGSK